MKIFMRFVAFMCIFFLVSCGSIKVGDDTIDFTTNSDSETSTSDILIGDLSGFVDLYSSDGLPLLDDKNVTVSIVGASETVTTNKDGLFTFSDLEKGVYSICFEKENFGEIYIYDYQFSGEDDVLMDCLVGLSATPDYGVVSINVPVYGDNSTSDLKFSGKIELADTDIYWIRFYFSDDETVSVDSKNYIYTDVIAKDNVNEHGEFTHTLSDVGSVLPKGVTLNAVAYSSADPWPDANNSSSEKYSGRSSVYRSYDNGNLIYTALGSSSNIVEFTLD
jgi:hypothetical protein